ncbi:MAG: DinB family protein [Saprospiraceae bacterium]|nr:DinB family protein [Saprospiraceae bacterium]
MVYQNEVLKNVHQHPTITNPPITAILDRIDQKKLDLFNYMKEFKESDLNATPRQGGWSAFQICHHLMLSEFQSLAYVKKKLSYNPKLKPANMATKMRQKLLTTYLSTPMKFKAPESVGTQALPYESNWESVEIEWANVRKELRAFLSVLPEEMFEKEVYKHPFAGRLSLEGMLVFFEGHFDRHVKQIKKTLRRVE